MVKFKALIIALVSTLEWYVALSHKITVFSCHPGDSTSSLYVKWWRNRAIIFESVFAWDNVNQICPSVSIAAISDNLGETVLSSVFPSPNLSDQVFRMKLVSPIQLSSIFMTLFFVIKRFIISIAYCYLRTSDLSEFAYG